MIALYQAQLALEPSRQYAWYSIISILPGLPPLGISGAWFYRVYILTRINMTKKNSVSLNRITNCKGSCRKTRDKKTKTDRETHIQTDIQTKRYNTKRIQTHNVRQTDRETKKHTYKQKYRQTEIKYNKDKVTD